MDDFRLDTFPDGSLIADLVVGPGRVTIELIGDARYEIAALCNSGRQVTVALWSTREVTIETRLRDAAAWAELRLGPDGNLHGFAASGCSLHLEHMDRGHYWLGLTSAAGETIHVDFVTPGYLKTKVTKNTESTAER